MEKSIIILLCIFSAVSTTQAYLLGGTTNVYSHDCLPPACKGCGYFNYASPIATVNDFLITCNRAQLSTFPTVNSINISQNSVKIDLSSNYFTNIPGNVFHQVHLQSQAKVTMKLDFNSISGIDGNAFNGISMQITSLDLSYNRLDNIPSAIGTLNNLRSLYLKENPLSHVDNSVTTGFSHSLTYFNFDFDYLPSWPNSFKNLSALEYLEINDIANELIDASIFDGFANSLKELSLLYDVRDNGPNFLTIPPAVTHLQNLQTLTIGGEVYCTCNLSYLKNWQVPSFIKAAGKSFLPCNDSNILVDDYIHTVGQQCH
ncbi:leucine-rich repeat-containing G-protein coupled receptor 5-like [Mercenaria mercenaria]|uniref:leucine-rich repeat-containing G-protein coupled receptor 5-like n=1 Tax=Mercenaria mercenaria TaxID=6596 RepID=UPI00234F9651|nr:leucine-rich repeat-containing G-protein coupled receptor 5-like [Mercenaria mercenaria]